MSGPPSEQTIEELQYEQVDLLHLQNSVGLTSVPWCSFRLNCINYACVALLIYYVALNLPPDIRRLWGRRSIATLLSAINWFAIIGTIITNTPLPANTIQRASLAPSISLVVPDILVVVATWYYISRTSSMRTQLVHDMWTARPNLITVMFRHGTSYFLYVEKNTHSTISLPNVADLVAISSSDIAVDISYLTAVMSSILVSHFLICIREAAERSTQALSSRSLSFIDSQGNSVSRSWLSSIEFAADIANPSARGSGVNAFSDLEDDLDSRGEDDSGDASNDGVELEEYLASVRSVDARTS
ncbi:predicted protein [Postia placenta Mad-698-R]|nr:predicted protein [Postia placenta Mad-698-R]